MKMGDGRWELVGGNLVLTGPSILIAVLESPADTA
jgi:hypothetical protein